MTIKNEPQLSLCPNCYCMTKTISGKCGKCQESKSMNEPQLSAEMEKRFDEALGVGTYGKIVSFDDIKHFLATALEEQRASIIAQLQKLEAEKWQDEEHCSCLRYAIHILNGKDK